MLLVGDAVGIRRDRDRAGEGVEATLRLQGRALEASTAGITISDLRLPDQPLVFANAAFLAMTGYRQDNVLGRNCRFLQGGDRDQPGLGTLRAALRAGRDCTVLLRNYRRDGTPFWNELTMAPVRDEAGALTHYIGVQTDVTARKEAEEGLRRAKGELERRVEGRTADLAAANAALRAELAERRRAEALLRASQDQLVEAQFEMLDRLSRAAEFRDDDTGQHTQRVGATAGRIAAALGLPSDEASLLARAALLHDIGKIGIPDGILLKPGRLTPDEWAEMRTHTMRGAAILQGSRHRLLQLAEEIALSHHERWDGRGYPQGLAGEAIPLSGRIVAVADVFDALTNARPYKPAWPRAAALTEIAAGAGSRFDPRVTGAFMRGMPNDE